MINYHTYHNSQLSILNSQLNKLQFIAEINKKIGVTNYGFD